MQRRCQWIARPLESDYVRLKKSSGRSRGTSWLCSLQQRLELVCVSSLNEEGVGIMPLRQENVTCRDIAHDKTLSQLLCSLLAALILIDIEGDIHSALAFTELGELGVIQMRTQRAGHIRKAGLTQHRIVEQSFDQDHFRAVANLLDRKSVV